jgi:hypothetical protein
MVGLLALAGTALAATPVAQEPLKAFGYHSQPVSHASGAIVTVAPRPANRPVDADQFTAENTQLSAEDLRYLEQHVTAPTSVLPHGLYTQELPSGAQVTAAGPFAPPIPGDPHSQQARFTLIGLTW